MPDLPPTLPPSAPQKILAPPLPLSLRTTVRKQPDRPCANCGDPTPGNYCRICGQRKVEVRVSLRRMLLEALDDQFSLNSALPRTLGALLFRPGRLTQDYMSGRIARYIPPFRLYLVSSLVFFVALSFVPGLDGEFASESPGGALHVGISEGETPPPVPGKAPGAAPTKAQEGGAAPAKAEDGGGEAKNWADKIDIDTPWPGLTQALDEKVETLGEMPPKQAVRTVMNDYLEHIPQMMFLLMPVFAGLLKLLYLRRKRFYVEHFVFALHLHAFTYLLYTTILLTRIGPLAGVLMLWLFVYIFWAMKRVYGQGFFRTLTKYLMLGTAYTVLMITAGIVTLFVTILML